MALVGTEPDVEQDVITDCVPGDKHSGRTLDYAVRVKIDADAFERLDTEIAARYDADGWTVKHDTGSNRVRFQQGSATVFADKGFAVVSGSGGCVE